MNTPAEKLLTQLQKVKRTKPNVWMACCPAHADKSASLSIKELDDGRVLIHCFAGCAAHEILGALGLELSDLFPPRDDDVQFKKGERRPFPAADILRAIVGEVSIAYLAAKDVSNGHALNQTDLDRLLVAASRIQAALAAGGINHER